MRSSSSLVVPIVVGAALGGCPAAFGQSREPIRMVVIAEMTLDASRACQAFKAASRDRSRELQGEVVRLMADLDYLWGAECGGWDEILPGLLRSARTSPEIRRAAALLLGRRGRLGFLLIPVVRLLTEPDAVIRQNALEDIGHMTLNYEFFADELAALAAHPEVEVRRAVAQAYRQLGKSPPTTLVAERLSAPSRAAEPPKRAAHPPISESEALRIWARLAQSATAPGNELRVLDDFFVLTGSPAAEARRKAATRWLRRVPPTERARLRAHFYLWSAGQWKVPD